MILLKDSQNRLKNILTEDKWTDWLNLVERLMMVNLSHEPDTFRWKLTTSGAFTVKSMYTDLINDGQPFHHKYIWKMKVPLKIKNLHVVFGSQGHPDKR